MNKRKVGQEKEALAAQYLTEHGYQILERNHKNKCGEIDIIAEKDGLLVICEVKFRSSDSFGDPLEAVDFRKQRRICRATAYYYASHHYNGNKPFRFDVLALYGDGTLKHIENAFEYHG